MDTGSEKALKVIRFDYLPKESPTKHGWALREGSEEYLLSREDPAYGCTLRIKAEQDLCLDYDLAGKLKQACKAVEFVFRSGSKFSFYAVVRFRSQQQEEPPPDRVRLRYDFNSDIEVSYPEPHQDYLKENEVEYGMPVTVEQLKDGWILTKIDLPHAVAAIEDKEWEFNELLTLRIKGSGVEIDVAHIELYKENPWERTLSPRDTSEYPNSGQASRLKIDLFESGRHDLHDQENTLSDTIRIAKLFGIWYDEWKSFANRQIMLYEYQHDRKLLSFVDDLDRRGRQTAYEVHLLNSINALEWFPDVDSIIERIEFVIAYAEENWIWISEQWAQLDLDARQQEIPNFGAIEFLKNRYEVFLRTIRGLRLHANRLRTSEAYLLLHSREGMDVSEEDGRGRQAMPQRLPDAEQLTPAILVSSIIRQLADLIRARQAGDRPYTLLLGSSLSLTPEVRRAVCGSDDWEAFWTAMERLSAAERRVLLASPLDGLNLTAGYRCLAQLVQAGYFDLVFTLNVDDALDESLRILSAREYKIFTHGQVPGTEIAVALSQTHPRVKVAKLRGDINAYKLPLTPEGQFEFPETLGETVERLLSQDTILVGDISHDTDIQRCIRQGEGALWVLVPQEPRPGSFLFNAKKARPRGEIICGPEAEFVSFFSALAHELGMEGPKTSMPSPRGRKLIEFTFMPPEPDDYRNWLSAFRRITEQHRANGSWMDNNDAEHKINRLEDFVKPFCKGQMYDASFALYSKDADGDFYEEVMVMVKVKPERGLSFEVTDRTQAQKRGELANTIQQEIGKLKGVQLISPASAQDVFIGGDTQVTEHFGAPLTEKVERGLSLADERAFLKQELAQHKRNLYTLREKAAVYAAGETPLHLLNQIESEEEEIRRIEAELERLER